MSSLTERALRWRTQRAYRAVWASPDGRRVLEDLLRFSQVDRAIPPADHATMAYLAGRARVGRRIADMLALRAVDLAQELTIRTGENDA